MADPMSQDGKHLMSNDRDHQFAPVLAARYLPVFHFLEHHKIAPVRAEIGAILDAVKNYDDREDPVLDFLLKLRELPARTLDRIGSSTVLQGKPRFGLANFLLLEETRNEVAYGLVGRFWRLDFGLLRISDAAEFSRFQHCGVAKLVMSYTVLPYSDDAWLLQTETRVWCPDLGSKLKFFPYWVAIRIASGWIRKRILARVKRAVEQG